MSRQDDQRIISDHTGITHLLEGLQEQRSLITALVGDDQNRTYSTAILAVFPDRRRFVLDELSPEEGHRRLLEEGRLRCFGMLRGVRVHFEGEVLRADDKDGISYYVLPYPEHIVHDQKRGDYRVRVARDQRSKIRVEKQLEGELIDLSLGGVGTLFPAGTDLYPGEILLGTTIELPDGHSICCDLEVRFVVESDERGRQRVGCRFLRLEPPDRRRVQRCVLYLEREELRRATRR